MVQNSYRQLCGVVGNLFWWYALRNNGAFYLTKRNLMAESLPIAGTSWTPNCVETARLHNSANRFATFAFLAGTLQDGCATSLTALEKYNLKVNNDASNTQSDKMIQLHFIKGRNDRRNHAKS
jgi:hypothetical protein